MLRLARVEAEGETGIGEQSRAAGLPGLPDRARGGLPVGLIPLGAVVHTETGAVGVGESIGIPLLKANHSAWRGPDPSQAELA